MLRLFRLPRRKKLENNFNRPRKTFIRLCDFFWSRLLFLFCRQVLRCYRFQLFLFEIFYSVPRAALMMNVLSPIKYTHEVNLWFNTILWNSVSRMLLKYQIKYHFKCCFRHMRIKNVVKNIFLRKHATHISYPGWLYLIEVAICVRCLPDTYTSDEEAKQRYSIRKVAGLTKTWYFLWDLRVGMSLWMVN